MAELPEALADRFRREVAALGRLFKTSKGLTVAFVILLVGAIGFYYVTHKSTVNPTPGPNPPDGPTVPALLPVSQLPAALVGRWTNENRSEQWSFQNGDNISQGDFQVNDAKDRRKGRYTFDIGSNFELYRLSWRMSPPTETEAYVITEIAPSAALLLITISGDKSTLTVRFSHPDLRPEQQQRVVFKRIQ